MQIAFDSTILPSDRGLRFALKLGGEAATFADVLRLWAEDHAFRAEFGKVLAECPYDAFRWETPSVVRSSIDRPFEFVVLNSPGLAPVAEPEAFAEHFRGKAADDVIAFDNLGKDATLIVPCPAAEGEHFRHLAAFLRGAPDRQKHLLWQRVAEAMQRRISDMPVWLSTAGAGVSWLHVRLDSRPKYYGYAPYRAR